MSNNERDDVELEAGVSEDVIRSDDRTRPDDTERLEIIRLIGQLGAGDKILWNERKQPMTVVRRVTADDLRGQCLNLRLAGRRWAANAINHGSFTEESVKPFVGGVFLTAEFGDEFLLVRGPRGGLYRLSVAFSSKRGRHIATFQNRVRANTHKSGRFRGTDAWGHKGTEVRRISRVGHDGSVDPDAVDTDDSAAFPSLENLAGRPVLAFRGEDGDELFRTYEFTDADVEAGVVPPEVSEYAAEHIGHSDNDPQMGVYNSVSGVTLDLSEYADVGTDDLPSRFDADTFLSFTRGEDGGVVVSEVPERVHHSEVSDDGAYIAEIMDSEHMRTGKVTFGSSYSVYVENGGKDAIKNTPSAAYDGHYQRWTVDSDDVLTALDALLDVDGVERITAPPRTLKYLTD